MGVFKVPKAGGSSLLFQTSEYLHWKQEDYQREKRK